MKIENIKNQVGIEQTKEIPSGEMGDHKVTDLAKDLKEIHGTKPPAKALSIEEKMCDVGYRIFLLTPALMMGSVGAAFAVPAITMTVLAVALPFSAPIFGIVAIGFGAVSLPFFAAAIITGVVSSCIFYRPTLPENERLLSQEYTGFGALASSYNLKAFSEYGVDQRILDKILEQKPLYDEKKLLLEKNRKEYLEKQANSITDYEKNIKELDLKIRQNNEFLELNRNPSLDDFNRIKKENGEYKKQKIELTTNTNKIVRGIDEHIKQLENLFDIIEKNCFKKVQEVCEKVRDEQIEKEYEEYKKNYVGDAIESPDEFKKHKLEIYEKRNLSIVSLGLYSKFASEGK